MRPSRRPTPDGVWGCYLSSLTTDPPPKGPIMTSPRVPITACAGDAPARVPPLPNSGFRALDQVPLPARFRDAAEAVLSCTRPAGPGSYHPADARYIQDIRRFTTAHMLRWGIEDDVSSAAELVASELVTNELRHGSSSSIRVRLIAGCGAFTLSVTGSNSYVPVVEMADPDDISRRGLFLVDHLARDHRGYWGVSADGSTWCVLGSPALRESA
ncbi:ATP-binding protein [Streptomyces xanthophaeus]|uniref:ATP-binding protein n=1 Tax=Streptomyces xanthophaeus TaxID=67385 RepID=UPI0036583E0F